MSRIVAGPDRAVLVATHGVKHVADINIRHAVTHPPRSALLGPARLFPVPPCLVSPGLTGSQLSLDGLRRVVTSMSRCGLFRVVTT